MEDTLITLFCVVDEFCKEFYPEWEKSLIIHGLKKRRTPSRYRSVWNFRVNILGALTAYALQPKKPSLNLAANEKKLMISMAA